MASWLTAAGCHPDTTTASQAVLVTGTSTTLYDTVSVGDELTYLDYFVKSADGSKITDLRNHWEVSDPTVLKLLTETDRVVSGGSDIRALALAPGSAQLVGVPVDVSFPNGQPLRFTANIVVRSGRPTILDLPTIITLRQGDTASFTANPKGDAPGTYTRGTVSWTSTDAKIASVHPIIGFSPSDAASAVATSGAPNMRTVVRANLVGQTSMLVEYRNGVTVLQKTITVNVLPANARVRITDAHVRTLPANFVEQVGIELLDAQGKAVDQRSIQIVSRQPALVTATLLDICGKAAPTLPFCVAKLTVNAAEVTRLGGSATAWIVATAPTAQPDSILLNLRRPLASIRIVPGNDTLLLGAERSYSLQYLDATGAELPAAEMPSGFIAPVNDADRDYVRYTGGPAPTLVTAFAVPSSGFATVPLKGTTGFVSAVAADGTPTRSNLEATTNIFIRAVARVVINPAATTVALGSSATASAQLFDAANRPVTITIPVGWSTSNASVFTVSTNTDGTARITPVGAGTANIIATVQGVTATGTVTVTAPANVPRLTFNPSPVTIAAGQLDLLRVTASNIPAATSVSFEPRDPTLIGFAPSSPTQGTVTGKAPGSTYLVVTYTSGSTVVVDSVLVNVTANVASRVARVVLEPHDATVTLPVGFTYRARFLDATGAQLTAADLAAEGGTVRYFNTSDAVGTVVPNADPTTAQFTPKGAGVENVTVLYTKGGQTVATDDARVTVLAGSAGAIGSLQFSITSPGSAGNTVRQLSVGGTATAGLIVRDLGNFTLNSGPAVTLTSSDPSVLEVSAPAAQSATYSWTVTAKKKGFAFLTASVPNGPSTTLVFAVQ